MTFTERLYAAQEATRSALCVGLDIDPDKMPKCLLQQHGIEDWWSIVTGPPGDYQRLVAPVVEFGKGIVDADAEYCCSFKPNLAFYEAMGVVGTMSLLEIVGYIRVRHPKHVIILDSKRNDIDNTAARYAKALFAFLKCDAATINPFLGWDTLEPFFAEPYRSEGRGGFVLCKTSNPGSSDLQNLKGRSVREEPESSVYLRIARAMVQKFGSTGNVGLVVGATYPNMLDAIRDIVGGEMPILIPGIGSQQGDLEGTMKANAGGLAIINVARQVLYASASEDWQEASAKMAKHHCEQINLHRRAA